MIIIASADDFRKFFILLKIVYDVGYKAYNIIARE